jgi:hypothetical protein
MEISGFILEPSMGGLRFDLYRKVQRQRIGEGTIQNPSGEFYQDTQSIGYDMEFTWCLEAIINILLAEKAEVVSIESYLKEYKSLLKEVSLIKYLS